MEVIEWNVDSTERMYCPSTGEVIFAPEMLEINEEADAFMGYWHCEFMHEPKIKNPELQKAWQEYYEKNIRDKNVEWKHYMQFFRNYKNPN